MNSPDNRVRPCAPICLRPEIVLVPRRSPQKGAAITQCHHTKLSPPRPHVVTLEMRRCDVPGAQLAQGTRPGRRGNAPPTILVPHGNRLHETTTRVATTPHSSH